MSTTGDLPIDVTVAGIPAPQGSKRHLGNGRLVESSKRVKPWRAAVETATRALGRSIPGPVEIGVIFYLPRPLGHYGTGRNAATLRPAAPTWPTSRAHGDLDKLCRSTLDALVTGGAIDDDDCVVELSASKLYADTHHAGATITIRRAPEGGVA